MVTLTEPVNYTYSVQLLRNFEVGFLKEILSSFFLKNSDFNKVWKETVGVDGWNKAAKIIEQNSVFKSSNIIKKMHNLELLEDNFYEELFNTVPDNIQLYLIETPNQVSNFDNIRSIIETKSALNSDAILGKVFQHPNNLNIINIKKISSHKLNILFRWGLTEDENDKKTLFVIPCQINLNTNTIQIRYKRTLLSKRKIEFKTLIDGIFKALTNENLVKPEMIPSSRIRRVYYEMFKAESQRAEDIIINSAIGKENYSQKVLEVENLLSNTFNISAKDDFYTTYKNRTLAMYLHQNAIFMDDEEFKEKFLFAFAFYDGLKTRSSTRNSDRTHVYTSNLYWSLKDLIIFQTPKSVSELGITYNFNFARNKEGELIVNYTTQELAELEDQNDTMVINYYKAEINFKEKNKGFSLDFLNIDKKRRDPKRGIKIDYAVAQLYNYISTTSGFK